MLSVSLVIQAFFFFRQKQCFGVGGASKSDMALFQFYVFSRRVTKMTVFGLCTGLFICFAKGGGEVRVESRNWEVLQAHTCKNVRTGCVPRLVKMASRADDVEWLVVRAVFLMTWSCLVGQWKSSPHGCLTYR